MCSPDAVGGLLQRDAVHTTTPCELEPARWRMNRVKGQKAQRSVKLKSMSTEPLAFQPSLEGGRIGEGAGDGKEGREFTDGRRRKSLWGA